MRKAVLLLVVLFLLCIPSAFAEGYEEDGTPTPTPVVANYQLPFPGLLPDNPLYGLKTLRDRIIGFLISDSQKKAEFDLLQAEKRLNAGILLLKKDPKKADLVVTTISKGQNYFEQAIAKTKEAKKQGVDATELVEKLSMSIENQVATLGTLKKTAPKDAKSAFEELEKRSLGFKKEVEKLP